MIDLAKLSPGPWDADLRDHNQPDTTYYAVTTPAGKVVCDTCNSEVMLIETEYDECDGVPFRTHSDVQGRADMEFVVMARMAFEIMVDRKVSPKWMGDHWGVEIPTVGLVRGLDPFSALLAAYEIMKDREAHPT
jgi:hypothetical protein